MAVIFPIAGVALGIGCGLLLLIAKRRESMAWGMGAVIASFVLISVLIIAVRALEPSMMMPSGVLAVLAFLVTAVVALVRDHRKNL